MIRKVYPTTICFLILIAMSVLGKQDRNGKRTVLYKRTPRETRRSFINNCCGNDTCSGQMTPWSGSPITNLKPMQELDAITSDGSADEPVANEGGIQNQQEDTDSPGQEIGTESPDLNQNDEPSASGSEISNNPEPDSATIKMERTLKPPQSQLKPLAGASQPEEPFRTRP
ncbi:Hypothetical predicted protein [Cloeon dipterum]|uniref:Post-SET domain-containing protein n=1 Tax=Cloeon dipterum TaxID=197152 RepID=A0A8S1DAY2_9INSE|nr:Hypothetical predicted protein [Cloeon dipterum]